MFYIGLMSGTSMDAVDAALVRIVGDELELIQYQQTPIPQGLQRTIRAINTGATLNEISAMDVVMGELFATAALQIMASGGCSPRDVQAIGSHGQTILHLPHDTPPRTLQIGDANVIAYQTGIVTVADFRRMDIAAGGEGAPLATALHQRLFWKEKSERVILNIGGIANMTRLPANDKDAITGFDTGPGNTLMDAWTQHHLHQDFDTDGQWAQSGQCHQALLAVLLDEAYFHASPPKSTGKDFFNLQWLESKLSQSAMVMESKDIQATLLALSVRTIFDAIKKSAPSCHEILVCGGGVHNTAMMRGLRDLPIKAKIHSTEQVGFNPDAVEATAFAWLAKLRMDNKPGNIPSVTGAKEQVVLGSIYNAGCLG